MTRTRGALAAADATPVAPVYIPCCTPHSTYASMAVLPTTFSVTESLVGRPSSSGPGNVTCASRRETDSTDAMNAAVNVTTWSDFIGALSRDWTAAGAPFARRSDFHSWGCGGDLRNWPECSAAGVWLPMEFSPPWCAP